jgi:hypothetical protein
MSIITVLILTMHLGANPPKPQPFSSGTDITFDFGFQNGAYNTADGGRFGIGMLTQRTGNKRWIYELSFVSRNDRCHYDAHDDRRYCGGEWAVQLYGGLQYDYPLSSDRKFFASLSGGFFGAIANFDQYYWDHYDYNDDNTLIAVGIMGKASLHYEFDSFRIGFGIQAGIGPSIGTESGIDIYFPIGGFFSFHYMFK